MRGSKKIQKRGQELTGTNEERISLDGVRMRGFLSLQPVQRGPTNLPRLHRGLAVLAQVFTGRGVVVESQTDLGTASAEQAIRQDEVGNQVAGGVVGSLGPFGGTEAKSSESGSVESSASHSSIYLCPEYHLRHYSSMRIRYSSDVVTCTGTMAGRCGG